MPQENRFTVATSGRPSNIKYNYQAQWEVGNSYGLGYEAPLGKNISLMEETLQRMKQIRSGLGLPISIHMPYFTACLSNYAYRDQSRAESYLVEAARMAKFLSCPVVIHPGGKRLPDHGKQLQFTIDRINKIVEETGVDPKFLCFENMGKFSSFGNLSEISMIAYETGCGICFDISHSWAIHRAEEKEEPFELWLRRALNVLCDFSWLKEYLHIHISGMTWDNRGEVEHQRFLESEFPLLPVLIELIDSNLESSTIVVESDKKKFRDARDVKILVRYLEELPIEERHTLFE